jgi:hypothetical protein
MSDKPDGGQWRRIRAASVVIAAIVLCAFLAFRFLSRPTIVLSSQAVTVQFPNGAPTFEMLNELKLRLQNAIEKSGVGEFDRIEIATDLSDASLFMHGPNADVLFATVRPILESAPFTINATVLMSYGTSDEKTREIQLTIGGKASADSPTPRQ